MFFFQECPSIFHWSKYSTKCASYSGKWTTCWVSNRTATLDGKISKEKKFFTFLIDFDKLYFFEECTPTSKSAEWEKWTTYCISKTTTFYGKISIKFDWQKRSFSLTIYSYHIFKHSDCTSTFNWKDPREEKRKWTGCWTCSTNC